MIPFPPPPGERKPPVSSQEEVSGRQGKSLPPSAAPVMLFSAFNLSDASAWPTCGWAKIVCVRGRRLFCVPQRWWSLSDWRTANEGLRAINRAAGEGDS